ncbi:hypothetical protein GMD78_09445 [Ornithinibacillus sp. L9]|uniref:Uncharacterized protein n=1 Tax=Ornithinibacillus caprae TaxID=2678566 RepID=A0A6N8FGL6_9BACI|nr:hypothetical protein [Ornithinibacillus caprae]MUK88613.1 hypothetical protein [Ornithinibacillus caprae]
MDKQLKDLKTNYEDNIPTSFTDHDKQAVLEKIKRTEHKQPAKVFPFYPKMLTGVVLAALILIIVISVNNQPNMFIGSSDESAEQHDMAGVDESQSEQEAEISMEDSTSDSDMEIRGSVNARFVPESVRVGDYYGTMEVVDVNRQGEKTTVKFNGNMELFGDFAFEGDQLRFSPHENTIPNIPLASEDVVDDILFYLKNEEFIRSEYSISDQQSLENSNQEYLLDVVGMEYTYSPNGSTVYLEVFERVSNTYETTIELSKELLAVYEQYKSSLDDRELRNLNPIDLFKMHYYAQNQDDEEVLYSLYIQGDMYGTPNSDKYFNDPFFERDDTVKENEKMLYQKLLEVDVFEEVYVSQDEAIIQFDLDTPDKKAFRLIKDHKLDVWKVAWLPMQ